MSESLSKTDQEEAHAGPELGSDLTDAPQESPAVDSPPLAAEHEQLLIALDRMLTTGSYYPPGHAQYVAVADQCADAVAGALHGLACVEIEVTTEGLAVGGGVAEKSNRCAQRLYELLEPLNQALLEIHADVTTEDLHEALSVLKHNHKQLAGTRDYQEIEIEGMPQTVSVTGRSLYVRTKTGNGPEQTSSPLNEYFDPNTIPDAALVPTPEGQMMEREFLAVIQGLMKAGNAAHLDALRDAGDTPVAEILGTWVPDFAIKSIKDMLNALEETNSDASMLHHLVGHAQTALQLTGDPLLVELIFEKLRKENKASKKSQPLLEKRPKPVRKATTFTLSRAELRSLIDDVYTEADTLEPLEDIVAPARADAIGICLQVLNVAPSDELSAGITTSLEVMLSSEHLNEVDLQVAVDALIDVFKYDKLETAEAMVSMVCPPLRHAHRAKLGPLWLNVWNGLASAQQYERAWPFVVNELLMGMWWEDPREKIALYNALSSVHVADRTDLLIRLENLPALKEKILAKELFHVPAPLLYGVHQLLMMSSLTDLHGPLMHQRLEYQKAHPLATILMNGFAEYNHAHRQAYQAILIQGVSEKIAPEMQDVATRHLKGTLNRLPAERREEPWVTEAIRWLGKLGTAKTRPVLKKIVSDKKFLLFPEWPAACRNAASDALAGVNTSDERDRHDFHR